MIPRALASLGLKNSGRDMSPLIVAFRGLSYLFHAVERGRGVGSKNSVRMGLEWPSLGGLALCHTQRLPTYSDPYFFLPVREETEITQHSLHQQLDR